MSEEQPWPKASPDRDRMPNSLSVLGGVALMSGAIFLTIGYHQSTFLHSVVGSVIFLLGAAIAFNSYQEDLKRKP